MSNLPHCNGIGLGVSMLNFQTTKQQELVEHMPRVNVKDKRKQQLIDANIASIAKRGLSETTIAHVSQGAGMSRGIVNFYFTTKEAMMQETCQYLADEYAAAWERALEKAGADAKAEDALRAVVAAQFTSAVCNQKKLAVWVAFWGHASSHKEYQKIVAAADAAFDAKVQELWAQVQGASVAVDTFAYELHALIRGSWLNFLLSSQASERDALAAKCDAYLSRALSQAVVAEAPKPAKQKPAKKEAVAVAEADTSNVTDLAAAKSEKAAKKKPKAVEDEQAALGDLFAM